MTTIISLLSDDPTQRKPVITLAKTEQDWEPAIMLDEGLKKTIEYFIQDGDPEKFNFDLPLAKCSHFANRR